MAANNAPATLAELTARVQAIESTQAAQGAALQQIGQELKTAVGNFTPTAARVSELSAGFQEANKRLAAAEATLVGMGDQAGMAEQVAAVRASLEEVANRLTVIETTRARSGRLAQRLAGIEAKLDQMTPPTGGTP